MRKIFIAIIVTAICVYITGSGMPGYCQDDEESNNSFAQAESDMDEHLDNEISDEFSEGRDETDKANEEMDTGRCIE